MFEDMFDGDFMTDEEIESAMDALVLSIGEQVEKQEQAPHIINPLVVQKVCYAYKYLRYLFKDDDDISVTYQLNEPYVSMGSVSVTGESLVFDDVQRLSDVVKLASNVEMFANTDGKVQIDLTFHGVSVPLK